MKGQSFFYVRSGSSIIKAKHWRKDRAHQHQMVTTNKTQFECRMRMCVGGGGAEAYVKR